MLRRMHVMFVQLQEICLRDPIEAWKALRQTLFCGMR